MVWIVVFAAFVAGTLTGSGIAEYSLRRIWAQFPTWSWEVEPLGSAAH